MKNQSLSISYILYLVLLFSTINTYSQTGYLDLKSEPDKASIYIDDVYKGTTPQLFELSAGMHKVEIKYENFESQYISISIKENEVSKQTITLRQATGFKVKKEQSSSINQAKGQLTIISIPTDSEVYIDGVKASQKTPITIEEIGAGDHQVKITNWILQNGKYEQISISKDVHVKPNKTELLKVDFKESLANLKISSTPKATVLIDNQNFGKTPIHAENLTIGEHKVILSTQLKGNIFYDDFTISRTISVKKNKTNELNIDFYKIYQYGNINVYSNIENNKFKLYELKSGKNKLLTTDFNFELITGIYDINYGNNFYNSIGVEIKPNQTANVFIPSYKELLPLKTLIDHQNYITLNSYVSNKNYYNEYKYKNVLGYSFQEAERKNSNYHKVVKWTASIAMATGFIVASNDPSIGGPIVAGGCSALLLFFPLHSKSKKVSLKDNIQKNKSIRLTAEKEWQNKANSWQKWTDSENEKINKKNKTITIENNNLKPASVTYE